MALSGALFLVLRSVADWRAVWWASAALSAILAAASWNLRPETPSAPARQPEPHPCAHIAGSAALVSAVLFGATFLGVSTLALAAGAGLRFPRSVALLTAGYSVGQILGPLLVAPLLHDGYRPALLLAALVSSRPPRPPPC